MQLACIQRSLCLLAVCRFKHSEAALAQVFGQRVAHYDVAFHKKDDGRIGHRKARCYRLFFDARSARAAAVLRRSYGLLRIGCEIPAPPLRPEVMRVTMCGRSRAIRAESCSPVIEPGRL